MNQLLHVSRIVQSRRPLWSVILSVLLFALCAAGQPDSDAKIADLIRIVQDKGKDESVREKTVEELGRWAPTHKAVLDVLIARLEDEHEPWQLQVSIATALRDAGPQARLAAPTLIKALKYKDPVVRWAAADALTKVNPPKTETLAKAFTDLLDDNFEQSRRIAADYLVLLANALVESGATEKMTQQLKKAEIKMLASPDEEVRKRAALLTVTVKYLEVAKWQRLKAELIEEANAHPHIDLPPAFVHVRIRQLSTAPSRV